MKRVVKLRLVQPYSQTGVRVNYLAQAIREMYFLTAFDWVGGNCIPYPVAGIFDAGESIKGPPTGAIWGRTGSSLAEKITKPAALSDSQRPAGSQ